ncbi:MAG: F0F1 ATP synthase subunit epsilon [Gammaproteobacteria bacterium]|jgi:F-type H+-transporting ATPase subunit epsilon
MRLKVLLPSEVLVDTPVLKIVAEAPDGWFGILPRHVDIATALVPSVLLYVDTEGVERFLGVDEGILVKCADDVQVSTRNAVQGNDLESLRRAVRAQFLELDDRERSARSALARLEAGVVRRFIELQEYGR